MEYLPISFLPLLLPSLEMPRSSEENEYLASVSVGVLQLFRKSVSSHLLSHEIIINQALQKIYTEDYLKLNAAKFLDNDWVNVDDLRRFIASKSALETHQRPVKHEADLCESLIPVKRERKASPGLSQAFKNSGTFRTTVQNGKEVIEIFSSDEDNHSPKKFLKKKSGTFRPSRRNITPIESIFDSLPDDSDIYFGSEELSELPTAEFDLGMSSDTAVASEHQSDDMGDESDGEEKITTSNYATSEEEDLSEDEVPIKKSGTVWLDHNVTSKVKLCSQQVNRQLRVDAVEYLDALPSYWPIPRNHRAYILDLSDEKHDKIFCDDDGKTISIDFLIKNAVC